MTATRRTAHIALLVPLLAALLAPAVPATATEGGANDTVRFSTFNASLNRLTDGALVTDLSTTTNLQAANVAETIQRVRPDVLLINEFDFDAAGTSLRLFQDNYLSVPRNGAAAISYPYRYSAPSNTGIPSGFDLDNNGAIVSTPGRFNGYGEDAFGFGDFPGQFGMAVYSKYPIDTENVRTFQRFLWKDMPGALLPDNPATAATGDWYSADELAVFRLSSKSHWDLPISIGGRTVHFLVSHPTPPVFDDPPRFPAGVDFNGRRNHDEIRFWADYVRPWRASYIYDDQGGRGGLADGASFVIAGDQNSDPLDGDSIPGSTQQLLDNPRVNSTDAPTSTGGVWASEAQDALNSSHRSDPAEDTADFCDTAAPPPCSGPGNLRADYVLPSKNLRIQGSGVFWPAEGEPFFYLTGTGFPVPTSDHRQVWADVRVPGTAP